MEQSDDGSVDESPDERTDCAHLNEALAALQIEMDSDSCVASDDVNNVDYWLGDGCLKSARNQNDRSLINAIDFAVRYDMAKRLNAPAVTAEPLVADWSKSFPDPSTLTNDSGAVSCDWSKQVQTASLTSPISDGLCSVIDESSADLEEHEFFDVFDESANSFNNDDILIPTKAIEDRKVTQKSNAKEKSTVKKGIMNLKKPQSPAMKTTHAVKPKSKAPTFTRPKRSEPLGQSQPRACMVKETLVTSSGLVITRPLPSKRGPKSCLSTGDMDSINEGLSIPDERPGHTVVLTPKIPRKAVAKPLTWTFNEPK